MSSTALERLVRPFQAGDVWSKSRLPPITQPINTAPPDDVTTSWEGSPDTNYNDEGDAWYYQFTSDLKEDKTQRDSKLVKIVNPDDPDDGSKLFVERINKTVFRTDQGKELSLSMDWSSPKDQAT